MRCFGSSKDHGKSRNCKVGPECSRAEPWLYSRTPWSDPYEKNSINLSTIQSLANLHSMNKNLTRSSCSFFFFFCHLASLFCSHFNSQNKRLQMDSLNPGAYFLCCKNSRKHPQSVSIFEGYSGGDYPAPLLCTASLQSICGRMNGEVDQQESFTEQPQSFTKIMGNVMFFSIIKHLQEA